MAQKQSSIFATERLLTSAGCSGHPRRADGEVKVNIDGGAASRVSPTFSLTAVVPLRRIVFRCS